MRKPILHAFNGQTQNLKGVRMVWNTELKQKLASMWEWSTYDELMYAFPGVGLDSLGTKVNILRREGYDIPKRKLMGANARMWISKITGKRFATTPRYRTPDGKREWSIQLNNGKRMRRYRYEMEAKLGRQLQRYEHVHHLDCNPENDDPENLVVVTKKEHFPFDNYRANMAEAFIKSRGGWSDYKMWLCEQQKEDEEQEE